jgi:hypothetical protein
MSDPKPLPFVIRRTNEIAQFLGSLSLFLSLSVLGVIFLFGSPDTAGYRFDRNHGWAYLGQQGEPEDFEFELLPNEPAARIDKGVVVVKSAAGGVFLRPEPFYPFDTVLRGWLGLDRDADVKGLVTPGTCARVNGITKTGLSQVWIHISIIDARECAGATPAARPAEAAATPPARVE